MCPEAFKVAPNLFGKSCNLVGIDLDRDIEQALVICYRYYRIGIIQPVYSKLYLVGRRVDYLDLEVTVSIRNGRR